MKPAVAVVNPNGDVKSAPSGNEPPQPVINPSEGDPQRAIAKTTLPFEHPTSSESSTLASQPHCSEPVANSETVSTESSKAKSKPIDLGAPKREHSPPKASS